jgi:polyisoprenoid-binding protein YceI
MHNLLSRTLLLLGALALGGLPVSHATTGESDLCAPFMDGKVDTTLVSSMLEAAKDGYLYRIRRDSSRVGFCVDSELKRVEAAFRDFNGGVALAPADWVMPDQQAMMVIQTASLDTRGSVIESLIKSASFFDVQKYPEILFISHRFEWLDADEAKIHGELTVRGITRPVTLDVTLIPENDSRAGGEESLTIKASTVISRSEFGMDSLSRLISDRVELCMSVEVVRYRSS